MLTPGWADVDALLAAYDALLADRDELVRRIRDLEGELEECRESL